MFLQKKLPSKADWASKMIRDRGKIKWTSLMLPEHVKLLREWMREDHLETKKEIDEQYLEVMNRRIFEAAEYGKTITILYYEKGRYKQYTGVVHAWDELNKTLQIAGGESGEEIRKIPLTAIADVMFGE